MNRSSSITLSLVAAALLVFLPTSGDIQSAIFTPCNMPTVVGFGTKPNVMIVMDYSGSMQFPAYIDFTHSNYYSSLVGYHTGTYSYPGSAPSVSGVYERGTSYYGSFDSDVYYVYDDTNAWWEPAETQPVTTYTITSSADGGGGTSIQFDAPGSNFAVNDIVVFKGLPSHTGMNNNAYTVTSISGSKFKVNAQWNGVPDKEGTVVKRIEGSFNSPNGISGNVLNFMITTRIDAALRALIGGRATCDADDGNDETQEYCYLRNQGARRYYGEHTNLQSRFYVRPAQLTTSGGTVQTYPDDYSSGTYNDKDIFLTTWQQYTGQLKSSDPVYYGKLFEEWKFTLTKRTKVMLRLDGTYTNNPNDYLSIYSVPIADQGGCGSSGGNNTYQVISSTANPAVISTELDPGTYYIRATYDNGSYVCLTGSYELWSNVPLEKYEPGGFSGTHDGQARTAIGSIPSARMVVRVPKEKRQGVIHKAFPYVRFGFTYYKGEAKGYEGKIAVGCHRDPSVSQDDQLRKLVDAFQGIHEDIDAETNYHKTHGYPYTKIYPYSGTPTGPAMEEMYDYFSQHTNHNNADNSYYTSSVEGTIRDPYYDSDVAGNTSPVPCRKSFVILLSDGQWNSGSDPTDSALKIHTLDVRPDNQQAEMVGDQFIDVYSIFAFGNEPGGANSMKTIAQYGGFKNNPECGSGLWPYDENGYPADSRLVDWTRDPKSKYIPACDPTGLTGAYNEKCCAEWDSVWDRNEDGIPEDKGIPDNYYEASNGAQLESALMSILTEVISRNAAASAVATVSQQGSDGDLIVRGAFEASDPDILDKYLWRGHVDSYWPLGVRISPYSGSVQAEEPIYEFGCPRSLGLLCYQIQDGEFFGAGGDCPERELIGEKPRCVDFAHNMTPWTERRVFTGVDVNADGKIRYATPSGSTSVLFNEEQEDFSAANVSHLESKLQIVDDYNGDGSVNTADAVALIEWVLGKESDVFRTRTDSKHRLWAVGDVVFSTPVIVGVPPYAGVLTVDPDIRDYYRYRNEKVRELTAPSTTPSSFSSPDQVAKKMVYVGSNDGQLHAFVLGVFNWETQKWVYKKADQLTSADDATDAKYAAFVGEELWSYIPSALLSELKELARKNYGFQVAGGCVHRTMVDLSPVPWQVYMRYKDENGAEKLGWRTVIVGGLRGGGDIYFAMDVTDPDNPVLLWEYSVLKDLVRATGSNTFELPPNFIARYAELKLLPLSWARPYVGRLNLPEGVKFYTGDPAAGGSPQGIFPSTGKRHVAFVGGSFMVYDETLSFSSGFSLSSDDLKLLRQPHFLALDIETGENLFKYVWVGLLKRFTKVAGLYDDTVTPRKNPKTGATITRMPQALSTPMAFDLLDGADRGRDGFVDHIYVGDMSGYFYGMKFRLDQAASTKGIKMDVWLTKLVDLSSQAPESWYRADSQPVTVAPAASREGHVATDYGRELAGPGDNRYLRVIFGSGKYDQIAGANDDKTDAGKMSLYNLRDLMDAPEISASSTYGGEAVSGSSFYINIELKCGLPWKQGNKFKEGCTWSNTSTGEGDCCENDCSSSTCWSCVYDLTHPTNSDVLAGERVINKAAIRDGWVYVTTYQPPSEACSAFGPGYLYIFDYMCRPFRPEDAPINIPQAEAINLHSDGQGQQVAAGLVVDLTSVEGGAPGVPSPPVLDSSGAVIIQLSNASIIRIPPPPGQSAPKVQGWRER